MSLFWMAVAPVLVIIIYVYIHDRYDKEPPALMIGSFLLGAVLSVIVVFALYFLTGHLTGVTDEYSIWQQFIHAFIGVALAEEFSKYIVVRYYSQPKAAFDEPYDGIIYAVMVSMGFACTENLSLIHI